MNERNINSETTRAIVAQDRNALAPRGGLAFDGTVNCRAAATLTGQVVGTDDVSLSVVFRVPLSASEQWVITTGPTTGELVGGTGGMGITLAAAGHLQAGVAVTAGYEFRRLSSFQQAYAGKVVHVVAVRTGATLALYVNGALQTSIAGDSSGAYLASSITSTLLAVNFRGTNYSLGGSLTIYSASLYNLALSAADVLEIYEGGGAVPERFKFGAQQNILTASFGNSGGTGGYETFSGQSVAGFTAANSNLGGNAASTLVPPVLIGAQYRIRGSITLNSGSLPNALLYDPTWSFQITNVPALTAGSFDLVLNATASGLTGCRVAIQTPSNSDFVLSGVTLQRLGAVVHLDGDSDGIGYQWHDQSTNKLDAVLTATGVSWAKPARRGYVRGTLTWAGTHELKSLLGQRCIPNEARWDAISAKATVGSSGSGIRFADASDTYSIATVSAFTTAKKPITIISANVFPGGTSDNNCNLSCDPDTANFTGSIAIEAQYSVTEGTP